MADVVLPASAAWCEAEGTVTNSERRVQRVRKALEPPGEARDDIEILGELAAPARPRTGVTPTAEDVWDELRSLAPMHAGMSYERLEELGGIQWPCPDEDTPGHARSCTAGCGTKTRRRAAPRAPFSVVDHAAPVDELTEEFPLRLTTGRRLDSLQHRRADRRLHLAAAPRGDARHLARGRRGSSASSTATSCA